MCRVIVGFHVLRIDVSLDLGFHVVICVGRLTDQQEARCFYTSTSFHHAYAIPNTKFFLLDVVVRLCPVIVTSICIPNSCIFHIAKKGSFQMLSLQNLALEPHWFSVNTIQITTFGKFYKPLNLCFPSVHNF